MKSSAQQDRLDHNPPPGTSKSSLNRLILDSAGEGIYGLDAEGRTTFVNQAAERMTGFSAREMMGKCQHELVHHTHGDGSPFPPEECPIFNAVKDGQVHQVHDDVFWRKDGTSFPVRYVSTPIRENMKLMGAVVVFQDITEEKKAGEEIRRLRHQLEMENAYLHEEVQNVQAYGDIIGASPALENILRQIEMVSPTEASVLITGESGTGKELVAREIHNRSARRDRTMIKVNCASIPRDLVESEFFGHVKGAFTGAVKDRAGRFQLADGGTLFLDEIGELPLDMQGKLLRVLQEGTFERIGDEKTQSVNVRIIAATNRCLKDEVRDKRFREDLFYRLCVFPIEVPPLRDRAEDIPLLASRLVERISQKLNRPVPRLTRGNMQALQNYPWPGNVRELQNVIERAVITARAGRMTFHLNDEGYRVIQPLQHTLAGKDPGGGAATEIFSDEEMEQLYRENLINALEHCHWKVSGESGAAALLGIKPTTLHSKIRKLGLSKPR